MLFGGISAAVDLFGESERGWDLMDTNVSYFFFDLDPNSVII